MPRLTPGDRHVNRPLTDMAIAAFQKNENFIAREAPTVRSKTRTNSYFVFTSGDLNRIEVRPRAPATRAHRAGFGLSTATFSAVRYSLGYDITDEEDNNYDTPLDPEADGARYLAQQFNMHREDAFAGVLFAASWGTNLTGVAGVPGGGQFQQWSETGSTPIEDVHAQSDVVLGRTGYEPNEAWTNKQVLTRLRNHPSIIDRYKANAGGEGARRQASVAAIAELLGIDVLRVSRAVKNTAAEGATAAHSFIFGKAFLLAYVNRAPMPLVKEPSAFYAFLWNGMHGAEEQGFRVKRYRDESIDATSLIGDAAFVPQITGADFGVYLASAIA